MLESLMVRGCPFVTEQSLGLIRGRIHIDRPRINNMAIPHLPRLYLQI